MQRRPPAADPGHTSDPAPPCWLVFYTDGLVERRGDDLGRRLDDLVSRVQAAVAAGDGVEGTADRVSSFSPQRDGDAAVLVRRLSSV